MSSHDIQHQPQHHRFICTTPHGDALITYRVTGTSIDFDHTFVPPKARGTGLAAQLVDTAADWARSQGYTLSASCWYARDHLKLA